jgi:hypothetical protein
MRADTDPGTAVNHLWRKAPLALIRYPGLFAAIVVGCLLLVVAAAAYPLFISATASDLVRSQIDRSTVTRFSAGITYEREDLPFRKQAPGGREDGPLYMRLGTLFRERAARTDLLGPTLGNIVGGTVSVSPPDHPGQQRTGLIHLSERSRSSWQSSPCCPRRVGLLGPVLRSTHKELIWRIEGGGPSSV